MNILLQILYGEARALTSSQADAGSGQGTVSTEMEIYPEFTQDSSPKQVFFW